MAKYLYVDHMVDHELFGKRCTICNGLFLDRQEKDNAVCSGKVRRTNRVKELLFAHRRCWVAQSQPESEE